MQTLSELELTKATIVAKIDDKTIQEEFIERAKEVNAKQSNWQVY